jgi:ribonucleoside-diphosphate reductase alpha chain
MVNKKEWKLPTQYQQFIHLSRYSRWDYGKKRRETWDETVDRYFKFFREHLKENCGYKIPVSLEKELRSAVLALEIMPSMRCLMTAGEALEKENIAAYNCAYLPIDTPRSFDELLYVLMNGTGVGFSVEFKYTSLLPFVPEKLHETDTVIVVRDSKLGWAKAFRELISLLYSGLIPKWDTTGVREAGAPLKTFGGRASGPEPLEELFRFTVQTFSKATGTKLTPLQCHDIVCKTAQVVVVGGVRRSALLSLSDIGDEQMRSCKSGEWWHREPQRALANNSANYHGNPDVGTFLKEWQALYNSKSGERGIFSSANAERHISKLNSNDKERREARSDFGTNPCSEIILRPREFCNLTEAVVRSNDTAVDLKRKVELATILGTWQSTLTNFRYLGSKWKTNCEEERLLGVSLTGIMDSSLTNGTSGPNLPLLLTSLKEVAVKANADYAVKIGIPQSASVTCVKPSGTVSQLVDSASGIHTRHSPYYIRTIRADTKDPLCSLLIDSKVPHEPDVTNPSNVMVFSFPMRSPESSLTRKDVSAIEQLELHSIYSEHWAEHKVSQTISVKEEEWLDIGALVFNNFSDISGVSFLPYSDFVYKQAPYTECSKEEYEAMEAVMPLINWDKLTEYEILDNTTSSQELACTAGGCEI